MRTLVTFSVIVAAAGAAAQMVSGGEMPGFDKVFGLSSAQRSRTVSARVVATSSGSQVLHPDKSTTLTFRLQNLTDRPLVLRGAYDVIGYRTSVPPGDIWTPHVSGIDKARQGQIEANLPARGHTNVRFTPNVGSRYGGYAIVMDFGDQGRLWGTTVARTVAPKNERVFIPRYAMDMPWPHEMSEQVMRTFSDLGVRGCRMGIDYVPTTHPNYAAKMAEMQRNMDWCQRNNITVMLTIGAGDAEQPLGRGRPWLMPDGTLIEGVKEDLAWLPKYDEDFRKWTAEVARRFGWPKGPLNAVELWNEPWEGVSISGWGADTPRYRELYRQMGLGVMDARKDHGVKVLIGGASSSSNTLDKLFPTESEEFLPMLDFVSIHYQEMSASPALIPMFTDRKGEYGPVQTWDTESWVANSDDRVAAVVASMRAQGQDRAMGTYKGNVYSPRVDRIDDAWIPSVDVWSAAAAVAATSRYIGQRAFTGLVFRNGLPWVFGFADEKDPDDATFVVVGDLGRIYNRNRTLFRTVQASLGKGGTLRLPRSADYLLLDYAGNEVPVRGRDMVVPLDGNGYLLRASGRPGSGARLRRAIAQGRIDGYMPVEILPSDFTDVSKPILRARLTNVLNRAVTGRLFARVNGVAASTVPIQLAANETREVQLPIAVRPNAINLLPSVVTFATAADGMSRVQENLRFNVIAARTIEVDGKLDDWPGALPQTIEGEGIRASMTEEAYLPFRNLNRSGGQTFSTAYVAADAEGFYFGARIEDPTPYEGNIRFATRDDDSYFYPPVAYMVDRGSTPFSVRWTGEAVAPATGEYEIIAGSDDGLRLYWNDQLIIDSWTHRGPTDDRKYVNLRQGERVRIRLDYFQGGGGAEVRLRWAAPGRAPALIEADGGFRAEYFDGTDLNRPRGEARDPVIDFRLGDSFPNPTVYKAERKPMEWPAGVRRFSYRRDPDLPSGNGTDNVQIAFNVLPDAEKPWRMMPPLTMPKWMIYPCTDYEFAFNQVAPEHGGGTETWCLLRPGMPRKHFYPRQPKAKNEGGPVEGAKLAMRREGNVRFVEAFLPWSAIPHVRDRLRAGQTVKFSYRVNDNDGPAYELAQGRGVSKDNPYAFHNDWATHWANELEFAIEGGRLR
jgi:hypothetical protein